ncbi:hypothetical protein ACPCHT_02750 [Nucisporomicrobium flavum]|uniref:hypothetical protein n=1 Tax=Nucisporomicrobium flavum TaxID=2785915 RepID=UPI0018F73AA1|nr:hypothetical protein [Nucisporomicrobium flavum]
MSTEDAKAVPDEDAAVAGWAGPTATDPGAEGDDPGNEGTGKGPTLDAGGDEGGSTTGKGVTVDGED